MNLGDFQPERASVSRRVPALETHRIAAHLQFHEHGLQPYWGLVSCYEPDHDDTLDGFQAVGDHWDIVQSTHWEGKIADPQGRFDHGLYEYQYRIAADDQVGDRDATFKLRPGHPRAEHVDTGDLLQGIPTELPECIRIQTETTNVDVDEVLPLLRAFFDAIGLNPEYISDPHEWSTAYELEGYVRVDRLESDVHLTGDGGMIQQFAQFGSSEGNKGEHKWDHDDHQGHYEAVALDRDTWERLIPDQQYAKRVKSYHPEFVRKDVDEDDPLSHPKLEVQLWPGGQRESVPWTDLRTLKDELQTTAANTLQWSGLGLDADADAFIEDAYHDAGWTDAEFDVYDNPIPDLQERIAGRAEHELFDPRITTTEFEQLEVIADGGPQHYEDLPGSSSLIYRMAKRLGIVEADNGIVRFPDEITRERIKSLIQQYRDLTARIDRHVQDVIDGIGRLRSATHNTQPIEDWMDDHGAVVAGQGRDLHFEFPGHQYDDYELARILREGYRAAVSCGLTTKFANALISYRRPGGDRRQHVRVLEDRDIGQFILGQYPLRVSRTP